MKVPARHADLAAQILAGGKIEAADVMTLRRGVFEDGAIDRDEVELVFFLDS